MDITDTLLPDPLYYPLPPSIDKLLDYAADIDGEGNRLTLEWATNEIRNHLTGFVRAGIVADKVRRFRLYSTQKFDTFKDWCQGAIGKSVWHVRRLIEAARVVLELARAGFATLPTCESQCRPLAKFTGEELIEKWGTVCERLPQHLITRTAIDDTLGEASGKPRKSRIAIDPQLHKRLVQEASDRGITTEELLERMLDLLDGDPEPEPDLEPDLEPDPEAEPKTEAANLEAWHEDLKQLIDEFDGELLSGNSS